MLRQAINPIHIKDLLLAGNFYGLKPQTGRLDASYGVTLLADGYGHYTYTPPAASGLLIKGEARDIKTIAAANGSHYIIVAVNNQPLYLFGPKKKR